MNLDRNILIEAAKVGAMEALKAVGYTTKDEISERTAFKEFGAGVIKRLLRTRKINFIRKGEGANSKKEFKRSEIKSALISERNPLFKTKKK